MEKSNSDQSEFFKGVSKAMWRAAEKVADAARREKRSIPVWRNNKVVMEVPEPLKKH